MIKVGDKLKFKTVEQLEQEGYAIGENLKSKLDILQEKTVEVLEIKDDKFLAEETNYNFYPIWLLNEKTTFDLEIDENDFIPLADYVIKKQGNIIYQDFRQQ